MDPLAELLKSVSLPIVAALGIIVTLLLEKYVSALLNQEFILGWSNPVYKHDTDRVIPAVTFLVGATWGWFLGSEPGLRDNVQIALLYGAAVLGVSRLIHKTVLGGAKPNGGTTNGNPQ